MGYIFENYEAFINDKSHEIGSPAGAMRMLNDDGMFEGFVDTLIDGYSDSVQPMLKELCERQREMIITEMANVPGSSFAPGWTVLSFPILVDIYSEPILAELCNVYPVQKPIISVPRLRIKAQTRSYDGRELQETYIPTSTKSVRSGVVEVNITPRTTTNVFTNSGLDPAHMKLNRQYTLMTKVHVIERDANNADPNTNIRSEQDVEVNFRPDNRAHFNHTFDMLDLGRETVTGDVSGNVNYEKGSIQYQVIFSGGTTDSVYECSYATMTLRFVPNATMNGRTKVSLEIEMLDLTIDPNEDFLIDLTEEELQDYSSIYDIDLVRTFSEAIKRQIMLNKDWDLAYFLKAAETDMKKYGAKDVLDLDQFVNRGGVGDYTPATVIDVLKAISPRIATLTSIIRRNYNMYPSYLVAGLKTASHLRSLNEMMTNIPGLRGELGQTAGASEFMKLKVLESSVIEDNKIYMTTKAPNNALEKSSIVDFIFQPLYIVKEISKVVSYA